MFTSINITVLGLTNPDVNPKRMHQLYNITYKINAIVYIIIICLTREYFIQFIIIDDWESSQKIEK